MLKKNHSGGVPMFYCSSYILPGRQAVDTFLLHSSYKRREQTKALLPFRSSRYFVVITLENRTTLACCSASNWDLVSCSCSFSFSISSCSLSVFAFLFCSARKTRQNPHFKNIGCNFCICVPYHKCFTVVLQ